MLAYVTVTGRGAADRLLDGIATTLMARGVRLAGVVQRNIETDPGRPCDMELHLLDGGQAMRISQRLGGMARGCRLDTGALESCAALAERALERAPDLVIVNKYGKQESQGRGFRPLIGTALASGIPVLTAVGPQNMAAFEAFAGGLADPLPPCRDAIVEWCARHCDGVAV